MEIELMAYTDHRLSVGDDEVVRATVLIFGLSS